MVKIPYLHVKFISLHICIGLLFAFFYTHLTIHDFKDVSLKIKEVRGEKKIRLSGSEQYLLKIWGEEIPASVRFNSTKLIHTILIKRSSAYVFFYAIAPELILADENTLTIDSPGIHSVKIKNCIVSSNMGAILLRSSKRQTRPLELFTILAFISAFMLMGSAATFFLKKFFNLTFNGYFFSYTFTFMPCLAVLAFLYTLPKYVPIQALFFPFSYFGFCGAILFLTHSFVFFHFLVRNIRREEERFSSGSQLASNISKAVYRKLMGYELFRLWIAKDLSDKCSFSFLLLVVFCAIMLTFNLDFLAEFSASIAFLCLGVSLTIRLMAPMKKKNHQIPS